MSQGSNGKHDRGADFLDIDMRSICQPHITALAQPDPGSELNMEMVWQLFQLPLIENSYHHVRKSHANLTHFFSFSLSKSYLRLTFLFEPVRLMRSRVNDTKSAIRAAPKAES